MGCNYNLRGLDSSARCPECGRAIAESLAEPPLRREDPAWRSAVALGAVLIAIGAALSIPPDVIQIIDDIVTVHPRWLTNPLASEPAILAAIGGALLLTRPLNAAGRPARELRRAARAAVLVALTVHAIFDSTRGMWSSNSPTFPNLALGLAYAAAALMTGLYARRLALRLDRPILGFHLAVAAKGYAAAIVGVAILSSIITALTSSDPVAWSIQATGAICAMVFEVYAAVALLALRRALLRNMS